ncbi:ATP-binding region ATPase domain protein [Gulosibacter molinativorax]|nr:ATP-binding region ATPase domain protein [Gulosibacter molinativorax]
MTHLGIVFHRHLELLKVRVTVDVFDIGYEESGAPRKVAPIDPFGYTSLPNDKFPAEMSFSIDGKDCSATAHIWPANQSGRPEFRLGGNPGSRAQGFYFYRNDRLLQIGGWNTLTIERPELEYVRIAMDIGEALQPHITINPEKAGLELDSDLREALSNAVIRPDGASFFDMLSVAEGRRSESRRYVKRPVTLVSPGRGLSASLRQAFAESVEPSEAGPVDIRWQFDPDSESLVRVDLETRTLWLNTVYREMLSRVDPSDNHDASVIKTLLLIVYSKYFEGAYLGPREKAEIAAWDQLLLAAVRDESSRREKDLRDDGER